tara:strand:- start:944 stop:2218 length:1275 start_codon:yes stop_codon:yes gene_type:complete
MKILYHIIVHALLLTIAPYVIARCILDRKYRKDIFARLSGIKQAPRKHDNVWVHASSAGEVIAASLLWRSLIKKGYQPVLSVFTKTGFDLAKKEGLDPIFRLPPDSPLWMNPLLNKLEPSVLILVESELWPALIWGCRSRNIPVILANGRMSEKSFKRYSQFIRFFQSVANAVNVFSMRSKQDAERIQSLGITNEKIHVSGNIKFDTNISETYDNTMAPRMSHPPIIIFGSTRPGDEEPILHAVRKLISDFSKIQFVIAPRHIERIEEIEGLIKNFGLDYIKHSDMLSDHYLQEKELLNKSRLKIILLDTLGDLNNYYKQGTIAFVGGGFNPRFGGHNILEPAVCGLPTIYGKHMGNFEEEARLLNESGGGIELQSPDELYSVLLRLLNDPKELTKRGRSAASTIKSNRGALEKHIQIIRPLIK